jgi:multiple sugar transport system substrate-binding protein
MKTRVRFVVVLACILFPLALFAAGKKYDGVNLTFLIQGGAAYDIANESGKTYMATMAEEFKAETGASVTIVGQPWENLMPKIMTDVQSGAGQFDGMLFDIEFQYTIYPYLLKIQPFIDKAKFDMTGFVQPVYKYGEWAGKGNRYGIPLTADVMPIIYRTDVVKSVPNTWDGFYKMLDQVKASGKVKYPVTLPGVPAQLVKMFLAYFWSTGDSTISADWKPQINDKNGLWALGQLDKVIKGYTAPGTLGYDNPDAANEFVAGNAGLYLNWLGFILPSLLNDDKNGSVKGKWTLAKFPSGGTGNFTQHSFIIMKSSKNAQATFDFIAKCTSKESMIRAQLDYGIDVSRESVLKDAKVLAKLPYESAYADVLNAGKPVFPAVPYWLELFIALADGLSQYYSGQVTQPQAALDNIAAKWQGIIQANPLSFAYKE